MTVIAEAMSRSAPVTDRRLPSQRKTGADASNPRIAPTVTPARSKPITAVLISRLAFIAGNRGPHAEIAIPPRPNAAVIVHRQRASTEPWVVTRTSVTSALPPACQKLSSGKYHDRTKLVLPWSLPGAQATSAKPAAGSEI